MCQQLPFELARLRVEKRKEWSESRRQRSYFWRYFTVPPRAPSERSSSHWRRHGGRARRRLDVLRRRRAGRRSREARLIVKFPTSRMKFQNWNSIWTFHRIVLVLIVRIVLKHFFNCFLKKWEEVNSVPQKTVRDSTAFLIFLKRREEYST